MYTLHAPQLLRTCFEPALWPEDLGVRKEYLIHKESGQVESYVGTAGNEGAMQDISTFWYDTFTERCDGRKDTETFLDACLQVD